MKIRLNKILSVVLVLVMLLSALPFTASAATYSGTCGDNLTWTFDDSTGELTITGTGDMYDYDFDSGYYSPWLLDAPYESITTLTIGNEVTSIGYGAFFSLINLTNVTIPDSVINIGEVAFYRCLNLKSVIIGAGVTNIDRMAFSNCENLTSIIVKDENEVFSSDEFGVLFNKNKTNLVFYCDNKMRDSYVIPDTVTSIDSYAFCFCDYLVNLTIPDTVKNISVDAFVPSHYFGYTAFPLLYVTEESYAATYAESQNIPYVYIYEETDSGKNISVTVSSKLSFEINKETYTMEINCEGNMPAFVDEDAPWVPYKGYIKHITINEGCTSVGANAFKNFVALRSVVIPDSVLAIGDYAFYFCFGLNELSMPVSAKIYNSEYTFYRCENIEKMTLTKGNGISQNYTFQLGGGTFVTHAQRTPWYISGCETIILEDGVTNIGSNMFACGWHLKNITIPNSVTSIGDSAFLECEELQSIVIPDSVTTIGDYAFAYCNSLTSVTIPDSVTTIGDYAFRNCSSLTSVTIHDGVTTIGNYAFDYCTSLTSVTIPDSVTAIGDYAFLNCTSLTSVTIPDSVTTIGDSAFYNCIYIGNVTLPLSVKSIGNNAFLGCQNMEKLKVYNRNCTFGTECTSYYTTICGYASSTAEAYADENGFGFELIPDDDHEHIYSNNCDAECNICGYINPEAGHKYDDNCDSDCNVCGDVRTEPPHTDKNYDGICDDCEIAISDILIGITQNFKVKVNETVCIKFVPANSGVYTFYSSSSTDTYGYIFNADKNTLASDDDGGGNRQFSITYTFKSGTVYYLGVRYYNSSYSGEIPVTIRLDQLICDHNSTHNEHKDSTCTEYGYDKVICGDCGATVSETELPLLDHSYKAIVSNPTCQSAGSIVRYCTVCKYAYLEKITDPVDHDMSWIVVSKPTSSADGEMQYKCSYCDLVEQTKVVPAFMIASNSIANINFETNTISGFDAGATSIDDYVTVETDGYSFVCDSDVIGTGTVIELTDGEVVVEEFTAVVFGDVNGDGWYDGTDSIIVSCLANGMLSKDDVSPAFYEAADCNHDGTIDAFDVALLEKAGMLLADIDQSESAEELALNEAYIEYLDLIDQTPENETVEDGIIETPEVEVETDEFDLIEFIITIIRKFFELLLSDLPIK